MEPGTLQWDEDLVPYFPHGCAVEVILNPCNANWSPEQMYAANKSLITKNSNHDPTMSEYTVKLESDKQREQEAKRIAKTIHSKFGSRSPFDLVEYDDEGESGSCNLSAQDVRSDQENYHLCLGNGNINLYRPESPRSRTSTPARNSSADHPQSCSNSTTNHQTLTGINSRPANQYENEGIRASTEYPKSGTSNCERIGIDTLIFINSRYRNNSSSNDREFQPTTYPFWENTAKRSVYSEPTKMKMDQEYPAKPSKVPEVVQILDLNEPDSMKDYSASKLNPYAKTFTPRTQQAPTPPLPEKEQPEHSVLPSYYDGIVVYCPLVPTDYLPYPPVPVALVPSYQSGQRLQVPPLFTPHGLAANGQLIQLLFCPKLPTSTDMIR